MMPLLSVFQASRLVFFMACASLLALSHHPATAQPAGDQGRLDNRPTSLSEGEAEEVEKANKWTVGLVGGTVDGPNMKFATEIQTALDDGDNLRVLATVSRGTKQNVMDLLYLKGIDVGFVNTAIFDDFKKEGKIKNIENRVQYISQIQISAFQLLVGPQIKTVKDLQGKKVVLPKGAWASPVAQEILRKNGVTAEFVTDSINVGIEKVRSGEVAAVAYAFAKGAPNVYTPVVSKDGPHILQVDYRQFADSYYVPVTLENADYPTMIGAGETVETIGAVVVLAVYNWPKGSDRFRKVERFIQYYFDRFDTLKKPPFHPQWKEINLAATVPGWRRYWYAEEMLKKRFSNQFPNSQLTAATTSAAPADEEAVRQKLKTMGTAKQQRLYDEFLQWKRQAR
jgi:TRAP-type uncharacterized transport system substrate-binding protein